MHLTKFILTICLLLPAISFKVTSQNIIPLPQHMVKSDGYFTIDKKSVIYISPTNDQQMNDIAQQFINQLELSSGIKLSIQKGKAQKNAHAIQFCLDKTQTGGDESYKLAVNRNEIRISAPTVNGCFYGLQTLLQLFPDVIYNNKNKAAILWKAPCVNIVDNPRFHYRGLMLDVSRHFLPVSFIKKTIDLMAIHKMNIFHWHLTDDQGWRIEIKKYPKLTQTGSNRKETQVDKDKTRFDGIAYGGFYTQEEIKEVVAYAASKYITIIPEIEMPGHALAALASYPELGCTGKGYEVGCKWGVFDDVYCAGKESTFHFIEDVLSEVAELFPGKYIHIGGDECPKIRWKECPFCQTRIKDENLKNEKELQSYFVRRVETFLNSKGKFLIGWDEILEGGLAPNAIVMSWRGIDGGIQAAKMQHKAIMTPRTPMYLNIAQSTNKSEPLSVDGKNYIDTLYKYEPIPIQLNDSTSKFILGVQANLWAEHIYSTDIAEHMIFPRLCALSEVQWLDGNKKDWKKFKNRLNKHLRRLEFLNVNYAKDTY